MSIYDFYHQGCMRVCLAFFWLCIAWLVVSGLFSLWQEVRKAPDGKEDRAGFHQDGGPQK